ncbi:MAG: T9SS type A sorting domain-containing protein [Bacteroidota bacterium]
MKHLNKLRTITLMLAAAFFAFAATAQITLPPPTELAANGRSEGGLLDSDYPPGTILYGSAPSNNARVIVFIHGYSSGPETWFDGNSMYSKAYNAGYRTAFVAVHPDKNSSTNGDMFKNQLNTICNAYGVSNVTVIAHSKGGVDTDVALVLKGAYNKVDRVITLGTPHFGTPLADLAQSGWVSWLSSVFGQRNAATAQLQTGTMNSLRNQIDNNSNRSRTNFRVIGGTRYNGVLWFSGSYLWWTERNNDGVVTYSSTQRPNSYSIPRVSLNHFDIAEGDRVWNNIRGQIPSVNSREVELDGTGVNLNPNATVLSRTQVLTSDRGGLSFDVPANAGRVVVEVRQMNEDDALSLTKEGNGSRVAPIAEKLKDEDLFVGGYLTGYDLTDLGEGSYTLTSGGPVVAIVTYENGPEVAFTSDLNNEKLVYGVGEAMNLNIAVENTNENVEVTGVLRMSADLEGNPVDGEERVVRFSPNVDGTYEFKNSGIMKAGVYNLAVTVEGDSFTRNLVTSLGVVPTDSKLEGENAELGYGFATVYPNPSVGSTSIRFTIENEGNYEMRVVDIMGRTVENFDMSNIGVGQHEVTWNANGGLKNGLFIVELTNGETSTTQRVILNR